MNKEKLKQQLISEGFPEVYEWKDEAGTEYPEHAHKGRVALYITKGSITFYGGIEKTISVGERFDVPVGVVHSAIVGPEGCEYVVGEEIEGDTQ
jgi:quercetin dioxygenase-like cupin family protein